MKKLPGFALIFVIVLGNTMAVKAADGDAEKGKVLFAVCMACHGENGEGNAALNAPPNWPATLGSETSSNCRGRSPDRLIILESSASPLCNAASNVAPWPAIGSAR